VRQGLATGLLHNLNHICACSGQNDAFLYPAYAAFPGDELNGVQSYGQLVSSGISVPAFE